MSRRAWQGMAAGALAALAALALHGAGTLDRLEGIAWDWRARLLARPGPETDKIRVVLLDQSSLDWGRETMGLGWPWPRETYAAVIDFCRQGGARAVAFDLVFTEPSVYGVEDDARFGAAVAAYPAFAAGVFFGREQGGAEAWPGDLRFEGLPVRGVDEAARAGGWKAALPVAELATNAAVLGSVAGSMEADAVIRRLEPLLWFDGRAVPLLGAAAWQAAHPGAVWSRTARGWEAQAPDGARVRVPVDRDGRALMRWRGPSQTHRAVSMQAVVQSWIRLQEGGEPVIPPSVFEGAYVLLGVTAPGLMDLRPTPMGPVYPGVEVHATWLDNLLAGDFVRQLPPWCGWLWVAALGIAAGGLGRTAPRAWHTVLLFAVLLPLPFAASAAAWQAGTALPAAAPTVAAALGLLGSLVLNYAQEGRQKRFIKGAFRQYLSPAVIERLLADPAHLRLGGERRELTIFFSDVQGFTSLSEQLDPEALTSLLNTYLTAMTDIILGEGGTIDKYEGDAIIAFWNAPLDQADHAARAVRAALACQAALAQRAGEFRERCGRELVTRIGIHTGPVVVGNMGSRQRFDYTFLGDAGNLASRLEGVNKQFVTRILVSEATRAQAGPAARYRELGRVAVVGRREPVRIFEPIAAEAAAAREVDLDVFDRARSAYEAGDFAAAGRGFAGLADADPVAARYAGRCRELAANPPAGWDGVWRMTEK